MNGSTKESFSETKSNSTNEMLLEPRHLVVQLETPRARTMIKIKNWLSSHLLLTFTFLGICIGGASGFLLRYLSLSSESIVLISYPGELFMRILKLMIMPLVIASLISGAASLNTRTNGRIAVRSLVYFLITSTISAIIGVIFVVLIHPGNPEIKNSLRNESSDEKAFSLLDNFLDLGRNFFPDNLFQATLQTAYTESRVFDNKSIYSKTLEYRSGTNTLGIIVFCLSFGTVLGSLGPRAKTLVVFFTLMNEVILKMVVGIMWISPLGIGSVICAKILCVSQLSEMMSQLGFFILTVLLGLAFYQFIVLQLLYLLIVRKNPYSFWVGCLQAWMTAFATASTAATLPITFQCMSDNNKVDFRICQFVLPIGATVNMDGTALFISSASIFIAQMNNMTLSTSQYFTVVLTATVSSIASASVPSAALVLMMIVLTAIEAPVQDISCLWAIDWFVDRCRTTNNLLGDCYGAAIVEALSSKELNDMDEKENGLDVETAFTHQVTTQQKAQILLLDN